MALMVHCDFILSSLLFVLYFFFLRASSAGFFCAYPIVATICRDSMDKSLERSGWNSSEVYEAMQRYQSAQAHAF